MIWKLDRIRHVNCSEPSLVAPMLKKSLRATFRVTMSLCVVLFVAEQGRPCEHPSAYEHGDYDHSGFYHPPQISEPLPETMNCWHIEVETPLWEPEIECPVSGQLALEKESPAIDADVDSAWQTPHSTMDSIEASESLSHHDRRQQMLAGLGAASTAIQNVWQKVPSKLMQLLADYRSQNSRLTIDVGCTRIDPLEYSQSPVAAGRLHSPLQQEPVQQVPKVVREAMRELPFDPLTARLDGNHTGCPYQELEVPQSVLVVSRSLPRPAALSAEQSLAEEIHSSDKEEKIPSPKLAVIEDAVTEQAIAVEVPVAPQDNRVDEEAAFSERDNPLEQDDLFNWEEDFYGDWQEETEDIEVESKQDSSLTEETEKETANGDDLESDDLGEGFGYGYGSEYEDELFYQRQSTRQDAEQVVDSKQATLKRTSATDNRNLPENKAETPQAVSDETTSEPARDVSAIERDWRYDYEYGCELSLEESPVSAQHETMSQEAACNLSRGDLEYAAEGVLLSIDGIGSMARNYQETANQLWSQLLVTQIQDSLHETGVARSWGEFVSWVEHTTVVDPTSAVVVARKNDDAVSRPAGITEAEALADVIDLARAEGAMPRLARGSAVPWIVLHEADSILMSEEAELAATEQNQQLMFEIAFALDKIGGVCQQLSQQLVNYAQRGREQLSRTSRHETR